MKLSLASAVLSIFYASVTAQTLSNDLLTSIETRMNESSTASWEIGTRAQTLIEIKFPSISVFSPDYLTPTPPTAAQLSPVISIARSVVNSMNSQQFVADGSAADPASIGVAVLLANYTRAQGANWEQAAAAQLDALLTKTPRSVDGAISHRTEYVQLWNDFVYMVPPFLAYYGVLTSNSSLISQSYNQIKLYRSYLRDDDSSLWRHIVTAQAAPDSPTSTATGPGFFNDTGHWSTGNGWVAAGMLRVLGTILNSPYAKDFRSETSDLQNWIGEIHSGMSKVLPAWGIFPNYADNSTEFPDAAATALFASTVYRAVTLYKPSKYSDIVDAAERARGALYANNGAAHFDDEGWLFPVVNPMSFHDAGSKSPEGQAFALQLDNNWKAWQAAGSRSGGVAVVAPARSAMGVVVASLLVGSVMAWL